jgi:hypothetical protein
VPVRNNVLTEFSNNSIEQIDPIAKESFPTTNLDPEPEPKAKTEGSFKCFYCDESFDSKIERINHKQQYHPDKPLDYPTPEDFENRLER